MNKRKSTLAKMNSETRLNPFKPAFYLFIFILSMHIFLAFALASDTKTDTEYLYIALVGPMSGKDQDKGREMADSANFYIDKVNAQGGLNGKKIKLLIFDDRNDSATATQKALEIAADDKILLVIGHRTSDTSIAGGEIYKRKQIPAITATATAKSVTKGNKWYFRVIFNNEQQGKFIANYVYHVLNHKIASIIYDQDAYGRGLAKAFEKATQTLGMTVNYKWSLDTGSIGLLMQMKDCINELSQKRNAGVIILALHTREAITLIKEIKDRGITFPLFGSDSIGAQTFPAHFHDFQMEQVNPGFYTDDIYTTSNLIYDTMGGGAKWVSEEFNAKFKRTPNATEMAYYDAITLGLEAIKQTQATGDQPSGDREQIRAFLAGINSVRNAFKGVTGYIYFDKKGDAQKSVPIGVFKNARLISAPVQLNQITNFTEIEAGKNNLSAESENEADSLSSRSLLLIDGAYVQKTFLVYTGIEPVEISKLDSAKSEFDMEFFLWFRYQQGIQPQHIEFLNAVEPIKLEKPVDEKTRGQIIYRKYQVKGRFKTDFLAFPPVLEQHILGINFHHKNLSRSKLTYIVDVLGMPEYTGKEIKMQPQFLSPALGYTVFRLRFFKDILEKKAMGSPRHLGVQKGKIQYSRFNMAIFVKKTQITLRRIIKNGLLNYVLLLLGVSFIIITQLISRSKTNKRFSKFMLIIQLSFTVLFLLCCEIMLLDVLAGKNRIDILKFTKLSFDILWWMVPAYFVNKVIKDSILIPNAEHNERTVPSLLIYFIAFIIYLLAIFGVVAFVFDQKLTSLLATSGVLAMIIGLAVQMNISNIFSGIAINLERSFRIGDWVKIASAIKGQIVTGKVVDITWRTTRVMESNGNIISIPNSIASESITVNYDYPDDFLWLELKTSVNHAHDPEQVKKILMDAINTTDGIIAAKVHFESISDSAADCKVKFQIKNYMKKDSLTDAVWKNIWMKLNQANIKPM